MQTYAQQSQTVSLTASGSSQTSGPEAKRTLLQGQEQPCCIRPGIDVPSTQRSDVLLRCLLTMLLIAALPVQTVANKIRGDVSSMQPGSAASCH